MTKRSLTLFSALGLVVATATVANASILVATFADPSQNSTLPLFTANSSSVIGAWTGNNLNLKVSTDATGTTSFTYVNTHMAFDNGTTGMAVGRTGTALTQGRVSFYTGADLTSTILTITFSAGLIYEPFVAGASSYISGQNVQFSGSAIAGLQPLTNQAFSFGFANPGTSPAGNTYTSSFTSSADAVPEPASMLALGFAAIAGLVRRRKA